MKLLRVHIVAAETCGGLLDGLDCWLRSPSDDFPGFDPLCLVGPNGTGKSQFLQILAEMFQSIFHVVVPEEERIEGNPDLQFELEYLIRPVAEKKACHVRVSKLSEGKRRPLVKIQLKSDEGWKDCDPSSKDTRALLPQKIIGYTSGGNETLSLPFLVSRRGYAEVVGSEALSDSSHGKAIADTRLMLIDYGTHLEVLVANLLLGIAEQRDALLRDAQLKRLHSFRCIIQLAHSAAPKAPAKRPAGSTRKGIQLTDELEHYISNLQRCATCYTYDEKTETYVFDFWVNDQTTLAFQYFWESTLQLYASFHKIAMLNDLTISKSTKDRLIRDLKSRRFASRLPEPQDEDKVFRFERVSFISQKNDAVVDYVSLSDGEHQLAQLLGTFCMVSFPNALFLLDEPESHFNPQWRVKAVSRLLDMPTGNGKRRNGASVSEQDCLLTTHTPFVPSDRPREKVFIFGKEEGRITVRHPDIETYGATFDSILQECFGIRAPISDVALDEIDHLMKSNDPEQIQKGIDRLGYSAKKVFLADRLRQLPKKDGV